MDRVNNYLEKYRIESSFFGPPSQITPDIIVVIPAYKENHILNTLASLQSCNHHKIQIEVLIYINGKENDSIEAIELNNKCEEDVQRFIIENDQEWFIVRVYSNIKLGKKYAGVGRARKLLMDDALFRFKRWYHKNGLIVNLDADTTVDINYFQAIIQYFKVNQSKDAVSIHFEHSLDENEEAIIDYELYLRYFIGMQCLLHLPFAYQTIGSAMAVRSEAYAKLGGMPARDAGEDFYFLHKFSKIGTLGKLSQTTVYPSSRTSDRVPFGTGRAISEHLSLAERRTYHYESFLLLAQFLKQMKEWYDGGILYYCGSKELESFAEKIKFRSKIDEIRKHTSSFKTFKKRFFQFFDAFIFMKYLHWMRDKRFPDITLSNALTYYSERINIDYTDKLDLLQSLRDFDRINGEPA